MASITREMILTQMGQLNEERKSFLANLHRIAGAEAVCRLQLQQLDAMEDQERARDDDAREKLTREIAADESREEAGKTLVKVGLDENGEIDMNRGVMRVPQGPNGFEVTDREFSG